MEKNSEKLKPAMTTPNKWKRTFNLIRQNSTTCYGNVPEEDSTCDHDMFIPKLKEETSPKFVKWETTVDKAHVQEISKMVHDANLELLKEKLKEEPAKFKTKQRWKFMSNKALSINKSLTEDVEKLNINESSKDESNVKLELLGVKTEITTEAKYKLTYQSSKDSSPPSSSNFKHKSKWKNLIKKASSQDSFQNNDLTCKNTDQPAFKSAYLNEKLAQTPQLHPKTKWKSVIKTVRSQETHQQKNFSTLNESHYLTRFNTQQQPRTTESCEEGGSIIKSINTITDRFQCKDKWDSLVNKAQTSQKALSACLTNLPK